jgi:hypothetical protein
MVFTVQPGCPGTAARLPKKPGIQKLTPPSSAIAVCDASTIAQVKEPTANARIHRSFVVPKLYVAFMPASAGALTTRGAT